MKRLLASKAMVAAPIVVVGAALAGCGSATPQAPRNAPIVSVTVGSRPAGRGLAPGFVGLSLEYTAVAAYADPTSIGLIRELAPGQRPVLRIGGNSTDETWWPRPGEAPPRGAQFALSARWLQNTAALAAALNARMILGLNLAGGRRGAAADEARAFLSGIGSRYIQAFEIGNEPDLYGLFPWPQRPSVLRRPASYSLTDFTREFSGSRAAVGRELPVAGPAYATFDWSLGRFTDSEPDLRVATFHHYPLDACLTKPAAVGYPTITSLLSDRSSSGFARLVARDVAVAHAHDLAFRLDELNSASCGGKWGVSNTFASALWMLDTLFNLARVGVDGVNVHTFPGAAYAPFGPRRAYPEYYGMLMFAQAFAPGARLLPVNVTPGGPLKAWATVGSGRGARVVLIDKDPRRSYSVQLRVTGASGPRRLVRLRAPGVGATSGVAIGGRETVSPAGGVYSITVPAASAVLLMQ